MRFAPGKVVALSGCSWCCGDLCLVNLPDGRRFMCVHCGRVAPDVGSMVTAGPDFEQRRRALSLGTTIPLSGPAPATRRKTA
jgi:hypothetical protein